MATHSNSSNSSSSSSNLRRVRNGLPWQTRVRLRPSIRVILPRFPELSDLIPQLDALNTFAQPPFCVSRILPLVPALLQRT